MADTKKRKLRTFPGLSAGQFQHPSDGKATDSLKAIPGIDKAVAKVMEYGIERLAYLDNTASNVRVSERMFPKMYKSLKWGCRILDIAEPELYVRLDPTPNAYTYGHTNPFITMTSGLLELLSPEECFFVIGHELGHIKADHVLYTIIADNISEIMERIGQATLGIGSLLGQGLVYALLEWHRKAELTADRAGLLCVQNIDVCIDTFMKLAGGAAGFASEMDRDEFLTQIRSFEDADRSTLNKAYKILLTANRSHPYAILRAKELDLWHDDHYADLLSSFAT
ncbi:MAG: M48 family metallopeptidase [Myxococcales bacterium]|nr:M48 family metallopeptidase [Myxococcales bacterium]